MQIDDVRPLLSKARFQLMTHGASSTAFLASILLSTECIFTDHVSRIATNGIQFLINPAVFAQWTPEERVGALAHELWHVVLKHCDHAKSLPSDHHRQQYNIAADLWINPTIKGNGLVLPTSHLDEAKYHGWTIDAIYADLINNTPMSVDPDLMDIQELDGLPNDIKDQLTPADDVKYEVAQVIRQAATSAKMNGTYSALPDTLKIAIDALMKPKIDTLSVLNQYMDGFSKDDYNFSKRNVWYQDFYAPSLYSEKLTRLTYAIDASASVSDAEFSAYVSHIKYTMEMLQPEAVEIIVFDDDIVDVFTLDSIQQLLDYDFQGRRGTDLTPVFDYLEKTPNKPTVLSVLSDLMCWPIEKEPNYPVLWVAVNNKDAMVNFGTLVHFEV